jgi:hypothetical protein
MYYFLVGINCCVLGPLTIYFSIEVKEFQRRDHASSSFFQE